MKADSSTNIDREDHDLFLAIAKHIKKNSQHYRETGKWLDTFCSEENRRQQKRNEQKELIEKYKDHPSVKLKECKVIGQVKKFDKARLYYLDKFKKEPSFISESDARRIILITWLLTDPDAEKTKLNITEYEKWSWEPTGNILSDSRGETNSLWCSNAHAYNSWMNLVYIAWGKVETEGQTPNLPLPSGKLYVALNCAERTLAVGTKTYLISSPKVWVFLEELVHNQTTARLTPRMDGTNDYKNAVDTLRRQIGKDHLRAVVQFASGGYFLHPSIKVVYHGQVGIRRTKQKAGGTRQRVKKEEIEDMLM